MKTLTYKQTGYFSKTITDFLSQSDQLTNYYELFPTIQNFEKQLFSKTNSETLCNRKILVNTLTKQYKNSTSSEKTTQNIQLLSKKNTFTVTTGHQLNLFTGPLYFLYKIISTINLCEELKVKYPKHHFVPIYWMATEDHDFEEIQYFNFKDKKVIWKKDSSGAVGRLNTEGLAEISEKITSLFDTSKNGKRLAQLFNDSYIKHDNLTDATRYLTNELFKDYGLVILDADDANLKKEFIPFIKEDLLQQTAFKEVSKTNETLRESYKIQVNPREINLFYLTDTFRERIILDGNIYRINNTDIIFSKTQILSELENHPERFSPNVILRPLYQEVILPNLCYIGGGGELAYWLELKSYFEKVNVTFPIVLLRNSVLIMNEKQVSKLEKLAVSKSELFLKQYDLIRKKVTEISNLNLNFDNQKIFLQEQFSRLKEIATKTDKSFIGAVNAQEKKQLKGLQNLEKRLLKAEKRKLKDVVNRITKIQNQLFPKQSLQERHVNFSEMYLEYGEQLIPKLKESLKPLDLKFSVLTF